MSLPHGGHLTHGWKVTISGQYYDVQQYGVRQDNHRIDMDEVRKLAKAHQPKLLIYGASAYPRIIDFEAFRAIADKWGSAARRYCPHQRPSLLVGASQPISTCRRGHNNHS